VKIDREKQVINLDEHLEDVTVEDLQVSIEWNFIKTGSGIKRFFYAFVGATSASPAAIHRVLLQNGP
jgi:hypothetical protein